MDIRFEKMGFLLALLTSSWCQQVVSQTTSAMFIFGDSLVDPGNNNYLQTSLAKANYQFNGIDFRGGITGRFCNGRTVADVICDLVGLPYPPPYLAPSTRGSSILRGVNYASGAGGILDSTGYNYISRIGMNQQISFFRNTVSDLNSQLGPAGTANLLSRSLFNLVLGSNDFLNNYLQSTSSIRFQYTPRQFNVLLLNTYADQLTTLYNLGARKFVVAAVGPIGCIPDQLAKANTPNCIPSINAQIEDYNVGLKSMLQQLTNTLQGSTFVYANVYDMVRTMISNPGSNGLTIVNQGCCGAGLYRGQIPCVPQAAVCNNRNQYVWWDPFHPTDAANVVIGNRVFTGGLNDVSPINIKQLVQRP